jgi:hypothetical protein
MTLFSVSGKSSVDVPDVPVIISRWSTSSMVLNVVRGDATQTFESDDGAPIQLNARASYLCCVPPISGSITMLPANSPISSPSLGETLKM